MKSQHIGIEYTSHSYWVSNCVSITTSSSIVVYYNLLQRYLISMMYIIQALSLVIFPMMIEAKNPSPGWFHTWHDVKRCLPRFAFPLLIWQISELRTQRILIVRQAHTVPPLSYQGKDHYLKWYYYIYTIYDASFIISLPSSGNKRIPKLLISRLSNLHKKRSLFQDS